MGLFLNSEQINEQPEGRKRAKQRAGWELLHDPTVITVSLSQAAEILNISKAAAHNAYKSTGRLLESVPVQQLSGGRRCVVATAHLRAALGIPTPALPTRSEVETDALSDDLYSL